MKSRAGYKQNPDNRGLSRLPLYHVWKAMLRRCNDPENPGYHNYGGRGISVCHAWSKCPDFIEWAKANGYQRGLDLDRIDNDGDYSPDNCRWVTRQTNSRNRRDCIPAPVDGAIVTAEEAAQKLGIHPITLRSRLRRGWSMERALRQPIGKRTLRV